ncbi:MAG: thioredoxin family protein [Candidatus Aminicenantes bacterium]|nr:thioredoxin family protein [Candidatus Aminicenantes bacterium]
MENYDQRMIYIGRSKVTLFGLQEVFEELSRRNITDEEEITSFILERVKKKNYVPSSAEEDYKDSLLEEYRIFTGELKERKIEGLLEIKILGPGCYQCNRMEELARTILSETGIAADIEHVRDPLRIAEYGLVATPALVINRKVKCVGRLPSKKDMERWIREAAGSST